MVKHLILELFISPGTYVTLCEIRCGGLFIKENYLIKIEYNTTYEQKFPSNYYIRAVNMGGKAMFYYFEFLSRNWFNVEEVFNNLIPNIRKLTEDELMIKDIIE